MRLGWPRTGIGGETSFLPHTPLGVMDDDDDDESAPSLTVRLRDLHFDDDFRRVGYTGTLANS